MIFLGIDPGLASLGYGLIEENGDKLTCIDFGVIRTRETSEPSNRLLQIFESLDDIITKYNPQYMVVEKLFFCKNVKTAIAVGQARGVVLLAAAKRNISFSEYTPLQVKKAITGYGQADKRQIQELVRAILGLKVTPKPDDAADALAIALCHLQVYKFKEKLEALK